MARRGRTADEARVMERIKRLAGQQQAFELALDPFRDDERHPDRRRWRVAFESDEPATIVQVKAATALFEGLVNHLVEMLHVAARVRGLDVATRETRPTGPALFAAVHADGGLTASQVAVLERLYGVRNELQHASPGVDADAVYDAAVLLRKQLKRLVNGYVAWLRANDVGVL